MGNVVGLPQEGGVCRVTACVTTCARSGGGGDGSVVWMLVVNEV